nr:hypothetical protein [Tanacetum cinerariifolium]
IFKIIGYHADFGKKKSNLSFKGKNVSNNNSVRTSLSSRFTDEQMATLISLIKDNRIGKNVQANMAEMGLFTFIQVVDPTKMKVKERERAEGEARLLDSTVGGNADQVDSVAGGGQEAEVGIAMGVRIVAEENVTAERLRRLRKKRQAITNADGSSHPPKKLRGDYRASSEVGIYGKSPSALRELLASSLLNIKVGVAAVPTLHMVTSSVSATPEHKSGALLILLLGPMSDFVPPLMTEVVVTSYDVDILPILEMGVKVTSPVQFNMGTARQACLNAEVKMRTEYCLSKRKRLESECEKQGELLKVRDAEIESLKARLLLKETKPAKAVHLHARVSASKVTEKKHASEIDALKQKNEALKNKKGSLDEKVVELQYFVSTKDLELKELNAIVSSLRSQKDGLVSQVHELELKVVNDKVAKLDADLVEMACHLEEKFYPHLLTTISDRRWILTHGLKLVLVKCLSSLDCLITLGAAISRSIKKGMHDGLMARIDHGRSSVSLIIPYLPN